MPNPDDDLLIHLDRLSPKPLVFEGTFSIPDLGRLEDTVANQDGELRYRVTATLDKQRRKVVSCIIEGFVFLTCQSSMEAFRHAISLEDRLVLVDDESRLPPIEEEDDTEDYLVADEPLDASTYLPNTRRHALFRLSLVNAGSAVSTP